MNNNITELESPKDKFHVENLQDNENILKNCFLTVVIVYIIMMLKMMVLNSKQQKTIKQKYYIGGLVY